MYPVKRDLEMLLNCNADIKSLANAKNIVLPRAIRHHSQLIKTAKQLACNDSTRLDLLSDAAELRGAVRSFALKYKGA